MGTITLVQPSEERWFSTACAAGAQARAAQAGHQLVVCPVPVGPGMAGRAAECVEEAFSRPEGLGAIAMGFAYRPGVDAKDRLLSWTRPMVLVGGSVLGFPVVSFDDVGAGRTVTEHLLDLGHTRIVHLTGGLDEGGLVFMKARARGYRQMMESAGLTPRVVEADLSGERLQQSVRQLLTGPDRPTAIVAVYDEVAYAVMAVAAELGLQIGRDLSLVGVNDHPDAEQRDLTTIRHHPGAAGAAAVEMILAGLEPGTRDGKVKSRLVAGSFVKRGSSSRLRAA